MRFRSEYRPRPRPRRDRRIDHDRWHRDHRPPPGGRRHRSDAERRRRDGFGGVARRAAWPISTAPFPPRTSPSPQATSISRKARRLGVSGSYRQPHLQRGHRRRLRFHRRLWGDTPPEGAIISTRTATSPRTNIVLTRSPATANAGRRLPRRRRPHGRHATSEEPAVSHVTLNTDGSIFVEGQIDFTGAGAATA